MPALLPCKHRKQPYWSSVWLPIAFLRLRDNFSLVATWNSSAIWDLWLITPLQCGLVGEWSPSGLWGIANLYKMPCSDEPPKCGAILFPRSYQGQNSHKLFPLRTSRVLKWTVCQWRDQSQVRWHRFPEGRIAKCTCSISFEWIWKKPPDFCGLPVWLKGIGWACYLVAQICRSDQKKITYFWQCPVGTVNSAGELRR